MKLITFISVIILTCIVQMPTAYAGWWPNDNEEHKQEIQKLEDQVEQQQESKGDWMLAAFILGIGSVVTLVAGAAIGSRGRRDATR